MLDIEFDRLTWVVYLYQFYDKLHTPEDMIKFHNQLCEASKEALIDTVGEKFDIDWEELF